MMADRPGFDRCFHHDLHVQNVAREVCADAARLVQQGWCQCVDARDKNGKPCSSLDEEATCFCLSGAIDRAVALRSARHHQRFPVYDPYSAIVLEVYALVCLVACIPSGRSLVTWNDLDGRSGHDVVDALRGAASIPIS